MSARGRAVALALLFVTMLGCVPSTADLSPTGAAGLALAPSDATLGQPFETVDGYRVTIDAVVLLLEVNVTFQQDNEALQAGADKLLFSGRSFEPLFVPGVSAGEANVSFSPSDLYLEDLTLDNPIVADDVRIYLGRFQQSPDLRDYDTRWGPSMLIAFHAEGHGSAYRASLTLSAEVARYAQYREAPSVIVEANELVTVPVPLHAERFFMEVKTCVVDCADFEAEGKPDSDAAPSDADDSTPLTFAELARADANADGMISAEEIRESSGNGSPLQDQLLRRAARILSMTR